MKIYYTQNFNSEKVSQGILPQEINKLLGKTPFEAALLLKVPCSIGELCQEFLCAENLNGLQKAGPAGETFEPITPFGGTITTPGRRLAHIFRARSLVSSIGYQFLKWFSSDWKEVTLTVSNLSEKILIKREDEHDLHLFPNIAIQ